MQNFVRLGGEKGETNRSWISSASPCSELVCAPHESHRDVGLKVTLNICFLFNKEQNPVKTGDIYTISNELNS